MRKVLLGLVIAAFYAAGDARSSASMPDAFARGNALFAEGRFADAAGVYESQLRTGEYSANLFYNLGDAYFRAGNKGRAILNFKRALLLDPRHAEAAANLTFLRGRTPGSSEGSFATWLDVDGWTWLAAAGGWLALIGLGAAASRARSRWRTLSAGLAGAAVCGVGVWAIVRLDGGAKNPARAVILADDTRALYSPADNSKVVMTLSAGGEVRVLSEQGAWDYVELGDGSRGWVAASQVEEVVPHVARG